MRGEGGKDGERGERVGGREGRLIEIWVREERKKKEYTIFYMGLFLLCAVAVITQESSTGIWKTMNTLI